MNPKSPKSNSVEKVLKILMAFTPHNQAIGTIEISRRLGFHRTTVSRILQTLKREGFVQQDPQTKRFLLGSSAIALGRAVNQSLKSNLIPIAKPHIDSLRDVLESTIVLEVFSGNVTLTAYVAEGPPPLRLIGNVGDIVPNHAAASAKVILAFSSAEAKARLVTDAEMPSFTPNTITDPEELLRHLDKIRDKGFSVDNEETGLGVRALGAPIFNHEGAPVAAIVVTGPSKKISGRVNSKEVSLLIEAASEISKALHSPVINM
jgi:IclR family transcriptional regulator, KDG regulon repressor